MWRLEGPCLIWALVSSGNAVRFAGKEEKGTVGWVADGAFVKEGGVEGI